MRYIVLYFALCFALIAQTIKVGGTGTTKVGGAGTTKVSGVASPTGTSYITSTTVGTPRNDFAAANGMNVTPNTNLIVTQLGRWVISGNSQTHALSIYHDGGGGAAVLDATVTVNCSGATPGQYLYGTLSPSFTMTNGTMYWVVSAETNGGDMWYDADTVISHTAVSSAQGNGYVLAGSVVAAGGGNSEYVPVDFKYN